MSRPIPYSLKGEEAIKGMQTRMGLGFCPIPVCGEKVKMIPLKVKKKAQQGVSLEVVEFQRQMTGVICPKHGRFRVNFTTRSKLVGQIEAIKNLVEREEEKEAIQEEDLKSKGKD